MLGLIKRYTRWLHTSWPAGTVEKLPLVGENGRTNVPGLYVVGDLTGIPLLKFSADSGARAVRAIHADPSLQKSRQTASSEDVVDVAIVGGGVSGMAAALEARELGLSYTLIEATQPFSTIVNFPRAKPIYAFPTEMEPAGQIRFEAEIKEPLLEELYAQTREVEVLDARAEKVVRKAGLLEVVLAGDTPNLRARRVVVAIGRSGNFRKLGVPGEELDKVVNRLHDPQDFHAKDVLVVGGGDSAMEAAIALAGCGARVTLSYRRPEFSRPKPGNIEKLQRLAADPEAEAEVSEPSSERVTTATGRWVSDSQRMRSGSKLTGSVRLAMASTVKEIDAAQVVLSFKDGRDDETLPNDAVFAMIGRAAPLEFFRQSGVSIIGDTRSRKFWITFALILVFCVWMFHWKKTDTLVDNFFKARHWFPHNLAGLYKSVGGSFATMAGDPKTVLGAVLGATKDPGFYYSLLYCVLVVVFGIRRIRRRKTPYVKVQTWTLAAIQIIPLFLLPYFLLPWMGNNGWFAEGASLHWFGETFFPDKSYWRSFGFVLAWPLFAYNWFSAQPIWGWLIVGSIQTFVLIPLIVWKWGKGAYCGWICSCGALAETLGDAHRHKMPHGPFWNRLNMAGQVILGACTALFLLRIASWVAGPESWPSSLFNLLLFGNSADGSSHPVLGYLSYSYVIDVLLGGIVGIAFYFHFSGRVWCRFFCPLAALMHIYARFTKFRILSDKKKCISCNVCTSVCHQGIDIMSFANKGVPMADPQCVRCSACVQSCPTGVLQFGEIDTKTGEVLKVDALAASSVRQQEGHQGFLKLSADASTGRISGGFTE